MLPTADAAADGRVLREKMNEKHINIRAKPLLLWSAVFAIISFLPLLLLFRTETLFGDNPRAALILTVAISAVAGITTSLLFLTLAEVVRKFRTGDLGPADLIEPGIIAGILALLVLGYILFPDVAWVIEMSFWAVCLIGATFSAVRRTIRKRRERRTSSCNILQ